MGILAEEIVAVHSFYWNGVKNSAPYIQVLFLDLAFGPRQQDKFLSFPNVPDRLEGNPFSFCVRSFLPMIAVGGSQSAVVGIPGLDFALIAVVAVAVAVVVTVTVVVAVVVVVVVENRIFGFGFAFGKRGVDLSQELEREDPTAVLCGVCGVRVTRSVADEIGRVGL